MLSGNIKLPIPINTRQFIYTKDYKYNLIKEQGRESGSVE